jgi:hypothetical protein
MIHKLMHWLQWNTGTVVSEIIDGKVYIGFKCSGCGEISGLQSAESVIDEELKKTS